MPWLYALRLGHRPARACGFRARQEYAPRLACTATARHSPSECTSKHSLCMLRHRHLRLPLAPTLAPAPSPGPQPGSCDALSADGCARRRRRRFASAAEEGDLATLKRLVEEGVDLEATDEVSAAPPARPPSPLHPSPSALAARRPCCPAPRRRRSPRVAPPPRLRRTARRPSCRRLTKASSTASSTSSPRVPSLTPQAT